MIGQFLFKAALRVRHRVVISHLQFNQIDFPSDNFLQQVPSILSWQCNRFYSCKKNLISGKDLDEKGFILSSILEQRRAYLEKHGMLQNKLVYQKRVVYENCHLYNINQVDNESRDNLERMQLGMCPISKDGSFIILHHFDQTHSGDWVVLTEKFHNEHHTQLHSNVTTAQRVNRMIFNHERTEYWQWKANQMKNSCGPVFTFGR